MNFNEYARDKLTKAKCGPFVMYAERRTVILVEKLGPDEFTVGKYGVVLSLDDALRVLRLSQEEHLIAGDMLDGTNTSTVIAYVKSIYKGETRGRKESSQ